MLLVLGASGCARPQSTTAEDQDRAAVATAQAPELDVMLAATQSASTAQNFNFAGLQALAGITESSANWPTYTFLRGEILRLRGDRDAARDTYMSLAKWAAGDPCDDGWGGSGLALVALWRCLQFVGEGAPAADEAHDLLETGRSLHSKRLSAGMYEVAPLLQALPRLEEDILRREAKLAWRIGEREAAYRLFLDYLMVSSEAQSDSLETVIADALIQDGYATPDRLQLFRGERLLDLGKTPEAATLLSDVRGSTDNHDVRGEAGLYLGMAWSNLSRPSDLSPDQWKSRKQALYRSVIDESSDPAVIEEAFYRRALLNKGDAATAAASERDLMTIVERFPRGKRADDALWELAAAKREGGNVDEALHYYDMLQAYEDKANTAYYHPAIMLYALGRKDEAESLLLALEKNIPEGPLHAHALFWLGRIAADKGDTEGARKYFREIIDYSPYDYYALRARMHLNLGDRAKQEVWPDAATASELAGEFARSRSMPAYGPGGSTPYHLRVAGATGSGLYGRALESIKPLRTLFPSERLQVVDLDALDGSGWFSHLVVLIALREDVLAAKDAVDGTSNRLQLAAAVGQAGDQPLRIGLADATLEGEAAHASVQRDPAWLRTGFPEVYLPDFRHAAAATGVSPNLLYGVARRESFFYAAARSPRDAIGLFQFTVFASIDLGIVTKSRIDSDPAGAEARRLEVLLDPASNIDYGAKWFALLDRRATNSRTRVETDENYPVLMALVRHNAGTGIVSNRIPPLVTYWKQNGLYGDVEYMIETMPFADTRNFIRRVYENMVIVDSSGMFDNP